MFSVIIPTLWRSPFITGLVKQLNDLGEVGEIIIVDNDITKSIDFTNYSKVKFIKNETNNFVNPSWSQGVNIAQFEKLCIINDDVIVPDILFRVMDSFINKDMGMVGLSSEVFDNTLANVEQLNNGQSITITKCNRRNFGYGCCIFMHRDNFCSIPDGMKIQYGDDWIFYSNDKQNYVVSGFSIVGKLSASLLDENMNLRDPDIITKICTRDHEIFWEKVDELILNTYPIHEHHKKKLNALKAYRAKSRTNYYF